MIQRLWVKSVFVNKSQRLARMHVNRAEELIDSSCTDERLWSAHSDGSRNSDKSNAAILHCDLLLFFLIEKLETPILFLRCVRLVNRLERFGFGLVKN